MATEMVFKMTMGKLIAGLVTFFVSGLVLFFGAVWTVGAVWLHDIRDDVRELRTNLNDVVKDTAALNQLMGGPNHDLIKAINETHDIVIADSGTLKTLGTDVTQLKTDMRIVLGVVDKAPWAQK
jgi:hypothetical protein